MAKKKTTYVINVGKNSKESQWKRWNSENPEKKKEIDKRYYYNHLEEKRKKSREYYYKNKETVLKRKKELYEENKNEIRKKSRKSMKKYRNEKPEIYNSHMKNWRLKNKLKIEASSKLHYALIVGKLVKPKLCEICIKKRKLTAHHDNYNKPLDVTWACKECHLALDKNRKIKEAA